MNLWIRMNSIKLVLIIVLFQFIFTGCSNDNPLAPYGGLDISMYFPLELGFTASYEFECRYSAGHGTMFFIRSVKGNCTINVSSILSQQSLLFAKLSSTFSVSKDLSVDDRGYEVITTESGPYTITEEYDLIQSADSVWYVSDAPDFSRLDEGKRSLLMHLPLGGSCQLDPDFIVFPGWDVSSRLYEAELKSDTLIYAVEDDLQLVGGGPYKRGTVKFGKNKGLESIQCTYGSGEGTLSRKTWEVEYTRL